jgi:CRISPR-associated exonuclease Cas4
LTGNLGEAQLFAEDALLPLSGLQHLVFCERQWALIHIEQQWAENRLTAEGRVLHQTVDEGPDESHGGIRIARSLPIHSLRLGLAGRTDVVEFPLSGGGPPVPVEYKRGKPKLDRSDEVQLCAQAICMEEMLGRVVPRGALYYGTPRRRRAVVFTPELRLETERLAARMHALHAAGRTPLARYQRGKCRNCSLLDLCQPHGLSRPDLASRYFQQALAAHLQET